MKKKQSAGILLYRLTTEEIEVFLVHPGRATWKNKGQAVWTIPQGTSMDPDNCLVAAIRHFSEVAGFSPQGPFLPLVPQKHKKGRLIYAWASPGNLVPALVRRTAISITWPPGSGRKLHFPRVDMGCWFPITKALHSINPSQLPFLQQLSSPTFLAAATPQPKC